MPTKQTAQVQPPEAPRVSEAGADALLRALAHNGVTTCFANPGTSEMQFVAALDRAPGMRAVLCLFEGVATGAADGYARMRGAPAATLLHLGPGYMNGGANLHNARRARSPIVNIVGDHATFHRALDTPLTSDIAALAAPNSKWIATAQSPGEVAALAAQAIVCAMSKPRAPVTLILPADAAWGEVTAQTETPRAPPTATAKGVDAIADRVRTAKAPIVLMGGETCTERGLNAGARLDAAGVKTITECFVSRQRRGAEVFAPGRLAYFAEAAEKQLAGCDLLLTVEAKSPAAFFAYPGRASALLPAGCETLELAGDDEDGALAMERLADALGAPSAPVTRRNASLEPATGELNPHVAARAIGRWLPADAIVSDDGVTASQPIFEATRDAAVHDWLMLTGGAIGQGLPLAIGAAVACPGRKVVSLNGDGAAMYTVQSLWTIARERLDVVVVIFANSAYRILNVEFSRTGSGERAGPVAARLLDLSDPLIDWVKVSEGLGVPAERCLTGESFEAAFARATTGQGPFLIEAVTGGAGRSAYAAGAAS